MDQVSHISQHLKSEIESRDLGGYYQERICIWPISKDLRGELGVADQERQQCSKSDCLTLKGHVRLKAQVHHHAPGDSIMSRPLDGELGGEIVFACVDDGELRGYHIGRVEWRAGGSILIGQLSGVTNAGTHRRPPPDWQPYDPPGHIEGRLDAVVADGEHKGCRLVAAYAIDFDPGAQARSMPFSGTLDGVLLCGCRA
jgi:hypothetical protein